MKSIFFKVFFLFFLVVVIFVLLGEFAYISYELSFLWLGPYFFWDAIRGICHDMANAAVLPLFLLTPFFVMILFAYRCFLNPATSRLWIILTGLLAWGITVLAPFIGLVVTCSSEQCLGVMVAVPFIILSVVVLLGVGLFFYLSVKNPESRFFKFFIKIINVTIAVLLIILGIPVVALPVNALLNKADTDWVVEYTALNEGPDVCTYHSNPGKCLIDVALDISQSEESDQKKDPFVFCDALEDITNQAECYYLIVQDQAQSEYSLLSYSVTDSLYYDAYSSCMGSGVEFDSCFRDGAIRLLGDVDYKSEIKGFVDLENKFKVESLAVCEKFYSNFDDQKTCSDKLFDDYSRWRFNWDKEFESTQRAYHIQDTIDNVINAVYTPPKKIKVSK